MNIENFTSATGIISISGFVFVVFYHIAGIARVKQYIKYYEEMKRGVYRYESTPGHNRYFRKYDYDMTRLDFIRTDQFIVLYPENRVKLNDNLYINTIGDLWDWYYRRKFSKLADELIDIYNWRELRERYATLRHDDYVSRFGSTVSKPPFKFLRG